MSISNYLITITAVGILIASAKMILPSGRTKKSVNIIFQFVLILTIVAPIFKGGLLINFEKIYDTNIVLDYTAINLINTEKIKNIEKVCKNELANNGIENAEIDIIWNDESGNIKIEKVKIKFDNEVIYSEEEHINITVKAIEIISELLNIKKEDVLIE